MFFYKKPKSENIKNSLKCAHWKKKMFKKKFKEVLQVCPQKSFKEIPHGCPQRKCCKQTSKKSLKCAQTNNKSAPKKKGSNPISSPILQV